LRRQSRKFVTRRTFVTAPHRRHWYSRRPEHGSSGR
jgi:hypothetical protein